MCSTSTEINLINWFLFILILFSLEELNELYIKKKVITTTQRRTHYTTFYTDTEKIISRLRENQDLIFLRFLRRYRKLRTKNQYMNENWSEKIIKIRHYIFYIHLSCENLKKYIFFLSVYTVLYCIGILRFFNWMIVFMIV